MICVVNFLCLNNNNNNNNNIDAAHQKKQFKLVEFGIAIKVYDMGWKIYHHKHI